MGHRHRCSSHVHDCLGAGTDVLNALLRIPGLATWLNFFYGPHTTLSSHISYMSLAGWPGSISSDKPIGVRGHHLGDCDLHGDRILLHLVSGGMWLSHRRPILAAGWSGKPYVVITWLIGLLGLISQTHARCHRLYAVVNPAPICFTNGHLRALGYWIKYTHNDIGIDYYRNWLGHTVCGLGVHTRWVMVYTVKNSPDHRYSTLTVMWVKFWILGAHIKKKFRWWHHGGGERTRGMVIKYPRCNGKHTSPTRSAQQTDHPPVFLRLKNFAQHYCNTAHNRS